MNRETSNIQGELFFQSFHLSLIHSLFANTVLLIKAFLQARSQRPESGNKRAKSVELEPLQIPLGCPSATTLVRQGCGDTSDLLSCCYPENALLSTVTPFLFLLTTFAMSDGPSSTASATSGFPSMRKEARCRGQEQVEFACHALQLLMLPLVPLVQNKYSSEEARTGTTQVPL